MNYIDIIIGVLLILGAINGFRKGFVVELASLAALVLGIWGAIEFSYITTDFILENFDWHTKHLNIISFAITFVVIVILVHIIATVINKIVEAAMLGFINRLAGLVFGLLKSALIVSIILVVFDKIDEDVNLISDSKKDASRLYEPVRNFAPSIFPFVDFWNYNPDQIEDGKKEEAPKNQSVV